MIAFRYLDLLLCNITVELITVSVNKEKQQFRVHASNDYELLMRRGNKITP